MTNEREQRGLTIAALSSLTKKGKAWIVPSQSERGVKYTVCPDEHEPHCTCPDHELRGGKCKHIYAVEFVLRRERGADGSITETRQVVLTETRKTYPQQWAAYNEAQTNEKDKFQVLLHNLCKGIPETQDAVRGRGRPSLPIRDAIFSACYKVYSTVSSRRFASDLREARDRGHIGCAPHFNSVLNVFDDPNTFGILKSLIEESAAPLKAIEENFACDSSGFSGCRFDRWFDIKYGPEKVQKRELRTWCKAHIMCGTTTNVVTAVEIFDKNANDGVQLPSLLSTTAKRFNVREVSGDLAYSSRTNLAAIDALGAAPMIPFKCNASPAKGGLWAKCYHYFSMNREEFLDRYHRRSNVESTFSMVKAKFGDSLRSKTDLAMKNETLAKFVCHNICCLISAMYELGVDPVFWGEQQMA